MMWSSSSCMCSSREPTLPAVAAAINGGRSRGACSAGRLQADRLLPREQPQRRRRRRRQRTRVRVREGRHEQQVRLLQGSRQRGVPDEPGVSDTARGTALRLTLRNPASRAGKAVPCSALQPAMRHALRGGLPHLWILRSHGAGQELVHELHQGWCTQAAESASSRCCIGQQCGHCPEPAPVMKRHGTLAELRRAGGKGPG